MTAEPYASIAERDAEEHISLCETLDRVLNKGVVVVGEIVISVADIDLVYVGLQLVLTSAEKAHQARIGMPQAVRRLTESNA